MNINKNLMNRNHTKKKRTKKDIIYIVIHYVGALGDAFANTEYYKNNDVGASADFFVGFSGDVWQGNDFYNYYSWHCGGGMQSSEGGRFYGLCTNANSIGIEMCVKKKNTSTMNATDTDWYFTEETEQACVELVRHLMEELDIDIDHVIRHYDVNGKYCPNPYLDQYHKGAWDRFKKRITGIASAQKEIANASELNGLSEKEKIERIAPLYQKVMGETGVLASVGLAQFCLESGYGTTDLAQKANNLHGMKCNLSGNTWPGSAWDGKSKYTKRTAEQDANGNVYYVTADFRKYSCVLDSIRDRAAYFIGAMNGSLKRYPAINKINDAEECVKIIKAGGYATDTKYVSKLMSIIERFDLTQYDTAKEPTLQERILAQIIDFQKQLDKSISDGKKWKYANTGYSKSMEDAIKNGNRITNCVVLANWVFKSIGIWKSGIINHKYDGTIGYKFSTTECKKAVKEKFDIIKVNDTEKNLIKKGKLYPGDLVFFSDHIHIYVDENTAFDGGRNNCNGKVFTTWLGKNNYLNAKAGYIIRAKGAVPLKKKKVMYCVQLGYYGSQSAANIDAAQLRDAGISCQVMQKGTGYKIQTNAFEKEENAKREVSALKENSYIKEKGINPFYYEEEV